MGDVPTPGDRFVDQEAINAERLQQASANESTQLRAASILRERGVQDLIKTAGGDSDKWVRERANQIRLDDTQRGGSLSYEDARDRAQRELATLQTVGVWSSPMLMGAGGQTWGQALLPRVEIVGLDEEGQYVTSQQGPGSWALDLLSAPVYYANAAGLGDAAIRAVVTPGREATPATPIHAPTPAEYAQRRTFSQAALDAAPETTGGQVVAAGLGALADVLTPDPVSLVMGAGKAALKAAPALGRAAEGAARATRLLAPTADEVGAMLQAGERVLDAAPPSAAGDTLREVLPTEVQHMDAPALAERIEVGRSALDAEARLLRTADEAIPGATRGVHGLSAEGRALIQRQAAGRFLSTLGDKLVAAGVSPQEAEWLVQAMLPGRGAHVEGIGRLGGMTASHVQAPGGATSIAQALDNLSARLAPRDLVQLSPRVSGGGSALRPSAQAQQVAAALRALPVVLDEARAAARSTLQEARATLAARGSRSLPPPRTVLEAIEVGRGSAVRKAAGEALGRGEAIHVTDAEMSLLLGSGEGPAFLHSQRSGSGWDLLPEQVAGLDAASVATQQALRGINAVADEGAAVSAALARALGESSGAIRIAEQVRQVLRLPVTGADEAAAGIARGISREAQQASIRAARAVEGEAARWLQAEGKAVRDADSLVSASASPGARAQGVNRWWPANAARVLYSPEALAGVVEKILPGARAHALSVAERALTDEGWWADILPATAPPEAWRAWGAWLQGQGAAGDVLREAFGDGLLLTAQEASALRSLTTLDVATSAGKILDVDASALAMAERAGLVGAKGDAAAALRRTASALDSPRAVTGAVSAGEAGLGRTVSDLGTLLDAAPPVATREMLERIAAAGDSILRKQGATLPSDAQSAVRTLWSRGVTRGLWAHRPGYLLNNIYGNLEQIFLQHGGMVAFRYTVRTLLADIVALGMAAAPAVADVAGAGAGAAARVGYASLMGTGRGKAITTAILNAASRAGDAGVGLVRRLLGAGAQTPIVTRIIEAAKGDIVLGSRTYSYRELYDEAARGGVFDGFDAADLGAEARGLADILPAQGVQHLAETISLRQRMGLYATLLDSGLTPREAAEGVVKALYDYRYSLSEGERGWVRWVVPFWSWQKNAQRQIIGALTSPAGWYRIGVAARARTTAATWLDQWYASDYDERGVGVGGMSAEEQRAYQERLVPYLQERFGDDVALQADFIQQHTTTTATGIPEDIRGLLTTAQEAQDWGWERGLPTYQREQAIGRISRVTKTQDSKPISHTFQPVWQLALPPSAVQATADFTGGLLAVAFAGLTSLASPDRTVPLTQVAQERVVDPYRMPLVASLTRPRVVISSGLYAAINALDVPGILDMRGNTEAQARFTEGQQAHQTTYAITDPALAVALDATGILAADAQLRRGAALAPAGAPVGLQILSALGAQASLGGKRRGKIPFDVSADIKERTRAVQTMTPTNDIRVETPDTPPPPAE